MKTMFCSLSLLITSVSAFAQGKVGYQNTAGAGKEKYIYSMEHTNPTEPWGPGDKVAGAGYYAQLFWAPMAEGEQALQPVAGSLTTFKSGTTAGLINGNSNLVIPGTHGGDKVMLQIRAWDNHAGTINSWADVLSDPRCVARGKSNLILDYELSGVDVDNAPHVGSGNMASAGLQSFTVWCVPEPSVVALSALGIGALVLRGRKPSSRR